MFLSPSSFFTTSLVRLLDAHWQYTTLLFITHRRDKFYSHLEHIQPSLSNIWISSGTIDTLARCSIGASNNGARIFWNTSRCTCFDGVSSSKWWTIGKQILRQVLANHSPPSSSFTPHPFLVHIFSSNSLINGPNLTHFASLFCDTSWLGTFFDDNICTINCIFRSLFFPSNQIWSVKTVAHFIQNHDYNWQPERLG